MTIGIVQVQLTFFCTRSCTKNFNKNISYKRKINFISYNSCWYEMPDALRKSLLVVFMRASNLCTINVGKICALSLQTFASVRSIFFEKKKKLMTFHNRFYIYIYLLYCVGSSSNGFRMYNDIVY